MQVDALALQLVKLPQSVIIDCTVHATPTLHTALVHVMFPSNTTGTQTALARCLKLLLKS